VLFIFVGVAWGFTVFIPETLAPVLLRRKAEKSAKQLARSVIPSRDSKTLFLRDPQDFPHSAISDDFSRTNRHLHELLYVFLLLTF
jgi:hypothetical protein